MIKLIATDMDGTLLDDEKNFPPQFFETLEEIQNRGILFVAASGRSFAIQNKAFAPASTKPYFLCDNGAFLKHGEEILVADIIDKTALKQMMAVLQTIPEVHPIFCGVKAAWQTKAADAFLPHLNSYFIDNRIIETVDDIDDDILKIAICDLRGSAENSFPIMNPKFGDEFNCVVSGVLWMDVMNKGINKGKTLKALQQKYDITPDETVVFGDFYNDVELLGCATYSFVMENANDDMKQYGNYLAPSNRDYGVQQILTRILETGSPIT